MSDSRNLSARLAAGPRFLIIGQGSEPGPGSSLESGGAASGLPNLRIPSGGPVRIDPAVADFPWNGVFTSDVRPGVSEAFEASWRRVVPTGSAQLGRNPRNATELNVRYLFLSLIHI